MRVLEKLQPLALLWLRLALGLIFFYYGYRKLFGDPAGALESFSRMGFAWYVVYLTGALEFFGALLLALGLLTRLTALLLGIEMAVALARVHIPSAGIYAVQNYQFPLALCAAAFTLAATGAGLLSMDAFTFERARKPRFKTRN